jgi:hypothetical protein
VINKQIWTSPLLLKHMERPARQNTVADGAQLEAGIPTSDNVGFLVSLGHHMLTESFTARDPKPSSAVLDVNGSEGWRPDIRTRFLRDKLLQQDRLRAKIRLLHTPLFPLHWSTEQAHNFQPSGMMAVGRQIS